MNVDSSLELSIVQHTDTSVGEPCCRQQSP